MYSTINSYRNDINREDLSALAAERRLARSATRPETGQAAQHLRRGAAARSLAVGHQVAFALCAVLALLVALAVPVVTASLV